MSEIRTAGKVGFFIITGVVLCILLILSFSKTFGRFGGSYEILLRARTVGGLTVNSSILMSGVRIGTVDKIELAPDGSGVLLHARVKKGQKIHKDAEFIIEQIGFLGDQYVAIYPRQNESPVLRPGEQIEVEQPFNFQYAARTATELLGRVGTLVDSLNTAVGRLNSTLLSEQTLTNATATVQDLRDFAQRSRVLVDKVGNLIQTNGPAIAHSMSNLVQFSAELDGLAADLRATVATNRAELSSAVGNFNETTEVLKKLAKSVDAGEGVVGSLLRNDSLQVHLAHTLSNLTVLSSNLNKYGLLYKPKKVKETRTPAPPVYPGRSPF